MIGKIFRDDNFRAINAGGEKGEKAETSLRFTGFTVEERARGPPTKAVDNFFRRREGRGAHFIRGKRGKTVMAAA